MKKKIKNEHVEQSTTITNNTFTGVHLDAKAIEGINNITKAILNLTELYKSQNITMGPMINVGN